MRMHVAYDHTGRILAAAHLPADGSKTRGPIPIAETGQYSAELDVPVEHVHLGFAQACRSLSIDIAHSAPRLKLNPHC